MSKKMKRVFAASLGLLTPATFAHENISNGISNSRSDEIQSIDSSSDRINSLCKENPSLSSLLTAEIFNKKGQKTGRITLEPLCEKHKDAFSTIFDIKEPNAENKEYNSYYQYFTSKDEITTDKGIRYYNKHINRINGMNPENQNIFFTILYSDFDEVTNSEDTPRYVGSIGLSRYYGYRPDLEVVINRNYSGKGIASNALKCMINFFNSYNFECSNDTVHEIEAIISIENFGSIGMVKKNSFVNVGRADISESNGHVSDRWILKLNTNPVLHWARINRDQSLILPYKNSYPERKMVTFGEFFKHPRYFSKCKNDYKKISKQISDHMNTIVDQKDVPSLKNGLSSWPIAWTSEDGKHMETAIDLKKLPDEISTIREANSHCKNKKSYIDCPDVDFKKITDKDVLPV